MQKTKKINFSENGIKQHKKKDYFFFWKKCKKKHPPWPLFNFMKFYGVLQILRKLLPLSQFLVYVDDIGVKMFRNLSTLYNMNSFFLRGGKIGLKLLKPLKIRNFSFFFQFWPIFIFFCPPWNIFWIPILLC